jgi:asparagine synthetase B (glutamine-hydrolysing)
MHFIDGVDPQAQLLVHPRGSLFYFGLCQHAWPLVADMLAGGGRPESLRGEFALVWISSCMNTTIAAVDHVCNFPLFYSDSYISNVFSALRRRLDLRAPNERIEHQLHLLGGHSLGEETTDLKIKRLQPGHYLHNGKQIRYLDLLDYSGEEPLSNTAFVTLTESIVSRLVKSENTLLISGGTDSTALAGIVKKLRFQEKFRFVHVFSPLQPQSELEILARSGKNMGLKVETVRVDLSGDIVPEIHDRQFSFWIENPFPAKRQAVTLSNLEHTRIFTGEIGDQLFGGPKNNCLLNYALQSRKVDPKVVAILWINQSTSYGKNASLVPSGKLEDYFLEQPAARLVYQELTALIAEMFEQIPSRDYLHRIMLMNYVIKGPYRTWAYSQDTLDWAHPFASWRLFDFLFRSASYTKVYNGGVSKSLLFDSWSKFVSPIPWSLPKHGFGIPTRSKLRPLS